MSPDDFAYPIAPEVRASYPSLGNKRVLVTGGGSGIGAGIVEGFVRQGAQVTFFDIAERDSLALIEDLAGAGPTPTFKRVDLTDIAALQTAIAEAIAEGGDFDVLVNNAASDDRHTIEQVDEAYWDNRMGVNLRHLFFAAQAVIPGMKAKGQGVIVNMGSISWHLALEELTLYQTAKAAIEGLTRSFARELGGDGIRSVCVIPGNVRTPRQLKWYTPEGEAEIVKAQCLNGRLVAGDIAAMILFLASDDARLVTGHSFSWMQGGDRMTKVQKSEPVSVWDLSAPLLEGPVWVTRDNALWFVCIKTPRIHRYDPTTGERRSWAAPGQCGFVLPSADGKFVAGLQKGLHRFDPVTGAFALLVDPEPALPTNRLNDGTVDPAGRLWFGTMDDGESKATGNIYRLAADGTTIASAPPVAITNGPAVSPDGRTLYHVDTLGGHIHACTIAADGSLSDRRLFVSIPNSEGHPDGPTVDAEGCVWVGLYGGWGVRRYSPKGELLETIRFPVDAITKIAFGGPDRRTVFATTANKHHDADQAAAQPLAGNLFRFEVDVPGLPGTEISVGI